MRELHETERSSGVRRLFALWKRVGKRIGDVQARALLTLFYFVVLAPFALAVRWASDPLAIKSATPRGWRPRSDGDRSPVVRATSQF